MLLTPVTAARAGACRILLATKGCRSPPRTAGFGLSATGDDDL
ncbi:hypothetical protein [Streptomyces sp. NPDC058991]